MFSCVNVTAVFALKKIYGCAGFETSNCFPKLHFAATTPARARIAIRPHNTTCQNRTRRTMIGNAMPNGKTNAAGMRAISACVMRRGLACLMV